MNYDALERASILLFVFMLVMGGIIGAMYVFLKPANNKLAKKCIGKISSTFRVVEIKEQTTRFKYLAAGTKYLLWGLLVGVLTVIAAVVGVALFVLSLFGLANILHLIFGNGILGEDGFEVAVSYVSIVVFAIISVAVFIASAIKKGKELSADFLAKKA
jgi:hypothetical protein